MPSTVLNITRRDDVTIVCLTADLPNAAVPLVTEAGQRIRDLVREGAFKKLLIDFSVVEFLGSLFLDELVLAQAELAGDDTRRMALCNVNDHTREVLHVTRLEKHFELCESPSDCPELLPDDEENLCGCDG